MSSCNHPWTFYYKRKEACGRCFKTLKLNGIAVLWEEMTPGISIEFDPEAKRAWTQRIEHLVKEGIMNNCQYCGDGPFTSDMERKIHEQSFCQRKPVESEVRTPPPDTDGKSGHEIDEQAAEVWSNDNGGRVTRLQFYNTDPNFVVSERIQRKFGRLVERRKNKPQKVFLTGEAGMGKTSLALQFAAATKSPTYKAPCPAMTEVSQWMGRTEFHPERGTFYVPSLFIEAIETPFSVVILNDLTRVENPKVLNPLMDILDETGLTHSEEMGRHIRVADGVVFFATANEGWEYTGADDPDKALKERFDVIKLPLPPGDMLDQIIMSKVGDTEDIRAGRDFFLNCIKRGIPLSIRHALRLCEDIKYGATLVDAAYLGMLGDLTPEHQEAALQILQVKSDLDTLTVEDKWSRWPNVTV